MAGAGYKLYSTGDVLSATDVNEYLQQQTVMVFASAAARTSALSAVLAEGMMSYLQDTNAVEAYNGSAWVAVGAASGAPASATSSGTATTSTSSATYVDTSAAATLTTGTKALVLIGATVAFNNGSEESTFISFKVSGATTSAATDDRGAQFFTSAANRPKVGLSRATLITGLTAGSNVFTLQIRVSASTGGVDVGYNVAVIDMGS